MRSDTLCSFKFFSWIDKLTTFDDAKNKLTKLKINLKEQILEEVTFITGNN